MKTELEIIVEMWNSGHSAGVIAVYFNTTRNAIIGKITRARTKGLVVRSGKGRKPDAPDNVSGPNLPVRIIASKPKLKIVPITLVESGEKMLDVPIYKLQHGQCKYSTGTNEYNELVFCGKDADGNYCKEHHKLCYDKYQPKAEKKSYVVHKVKYSNMGGLR